MMMMLRGVVSATRLMLSSREELFLVLVEWMLIPDRHAFVGERQYYTGNMTAAAVAVDRNCEQIQTEVVPLSVVVVAAAA